MNTNNLVLLLIDIQQMFLDTMSGNKEPLIRKYEQLIRFATWRNIPIITTYEHPVEKKGTLPASLEKILPKNHKNFFKYTFSCYKEPLIREALLQYKQVAVVGAETDVCVLQTVQDLLRNNVKVYLLEDCLFSSETNVQPALKRMYNAGAIPTTYKILFYELLETVNNLKLPKQIIFPEDLE